MKGEEICGKMPCKFLLSYVKSVSIFKSLKANIISGSNNVLRKRRYWVGD
jgi:hypothetical protein